MAVNPKNLHEIVFSSSDPVESRRTGVMVKNGELRKIAPRVYTTSADAPADVVRRNYLKIIGHLFPGAVISHRSALTGGQPENNIVYITTGRSGTTKLPGLTIRSLKGSGPLPEDMAVPEGLFIASEARALLENCQAARKSRDGIRKTVDRKVLEDRIEKLCRIRGEAFLNKLRDQARQVAVNLHMDAEYQKLANIIGTILGTKKVALKSLVARARAGGVPYDPDRIVRFKLLQQYLSKKIFPQYPASTEDAWCNVSFFDAYFSNFIEGTEFDVDVAADIVFQNKPLLQRPKDSHDILGAYQLLGNKNEMQQCAASGDELVRLIKTRHAIMMSGRPEINPGEYKEERNRAGKTAFVEPELIEGTLQKGYEYYSMLNGPFARAAYIMFMVTEVHPFEDGNGRVSRAMMNAEMISANQQRIIIPSVYREDYLLSLRRLSRQDDPAAFTSMLERAWLFTALVDFSDYQKACEIMESCNAFGDPADDALRMPDEEK